MHASSTDLPPRSPDSMVSYPRNVALASPIAEVNRDEIRITPAGAALYRQFSEPAKGIRSVFDDLESIVKAALE